MDIVTTGEKGGIGVDIQSNNDPVTASISGGAIRVQDQSDTGFEAMGVQAASYPGGEISLNLNADVSVSTTSQDPSAAVYGVKIASNTISAIPLYITDENGMKISLYRLPRSSATHFSAKQDGVDVSDQYADLWVFFLFDDAELAFDSETCDLYMVSIDGIIRYRNLGLPAEIGRLFYGTENIGYHDDSGIPTGVQSPVTITLYSSETDPGTTLVI